MPTIITDGKGNYLALSASGDWEPTEAPKQPADTAAIDPYSQQPLDPAVAATMPQDKPFAPPTSAPSNPTIGSIPIMLAPAPGAGARVGQAAAEGFRGGLNLLPPKDLAPFGPLGQAAGQYIVNPLAAIAGGAFRGGQQFVQEAISPISPALGRDVAAIPEAFQGSPELMPRQPPETPPTPRFVQEYYGQGTPENPLAPKPRVTVQADVRQPEAAPAAPDTAAPPPPEPAPASVGAAASREGTPASELGMTPAQEAAYRSTAEGNKLLEPQEPGVRDDKQYLPNERINEAEASQDVQIARELKSLRQQTPALDAQMTSDENFNNNLRTNAIHNALPGQVQITAAKAARQAAMQTAEPKVFANATDADVQPIVQTITDTLNEPKNRQNSQLQQYVRPLIGRLLNDDGTPKITDARELWGFRQDVQHLTSSAAQRSDPNLSRVSGILGNVLDTIDNQIEAAAPGYKAQLRDDYRTRSQQIDAMEALNEQRNKLFDGYNKPNYNAVQSMMRRIVDARQANDPYDPFTHVTQDTLDQLWNIRDSMRRSGAADRLAAPKGSPTSQNIGDALRAAGKMAIQSAAPTIGAGIGASLMPGMPMVGSALGIGAGATVNHFFSQRGLAQRFARGQELLTPNNPLGPGP